jgi:Protein of unknown function (DUF2851)
MTERLLQYIWQFQHYNKNALLTTSGETLQIIRPGTFNRNQGPDFSNASIKVGNTTWAGNIELHIQSSDWLLHRHSADKNYNNVILHVVWQDDVPLNTAFYTLVLQERVPKLLLKKYETLMMAASFIPCQASFSKADGLVFVAWKERLLSERLEHKAAIFNSYLGQTNNHWEESFWWLIARNFGASVNSPAFEKIAQTIPINTLAKVKGQIHQLEALLFGQAGLLEGEFEEDYPRMLAKEYRFLQAKYQLTPAHVQLYFLRMRPANFPTIRLAQLAMLVHQSVHLFARVKESNSIKELHGLLDITANDYWHYHYVFDEKTVYKPKKMGASMINSLLINTVVPAVYAYGVYHQQDAYKNKAAQWLEALPAEKNAITSGFEELGAINKSAMDSQALIQLKNEYCNQKRCLDCAVGNKILAGEAE